MRAGLFAQAEAPWLQALELEPDNALNLINFGGVLNGLNRVEEAVSLHRRAIAQDPDNMLCRINLAISLRPWGIS